jgi:hypothetical protein
MKIQRKQIFLILATLIMTITVVSMTLSSQQQPAADTQAKMAAKQEHSKLYKKYRSGKKLREVAAETPETEVAVIVGIPQRVFSPDSPPFNLRSFLKDMACDSDAVVVGVINDQFSQLTEDEDFVFTDYRMAVEQVLKDNSVAPIQSASDLTITRPGGVIQLENKSVRALDESLEPLRIGNRYILFLKYIPATASYEAFNSSGSFQISDKKTIKLTRESLPGELESGRDAGSLFLQIRGALAIPCNN